MDEEKYTLSKLIDLTGLIRSPIVKSPRLKYSNFDVSRNYLILAATSGSLYIFKRSPFSFFKIIPSVLGQITNIAISHDENIVAFSNNSTVGFVDLRDCCNPRNIPQTQLPNRASLTCFFWNYDNKQLYVGDKSGNVSIINLSYFIGRNILNVSIHPILLLDTPIVQISGFNDYLLVSTTTKCVLCNNERETFKQIGNRPRDGDFGACFTINFEKMEEQQKQMMINTIDDYELMLQTHVKIYCARPGLRLWECDLNGNVLTTLQFKNSLNTHPRWPLEGASEREANKSTVLDKNIQFRTMYTLSHMFLVIFNSFGFFILDPLRSKVLFWTNEFNKTISSAKLIDNCIFLHLIDGKMYQINFYKVEQYLYHLCETEQYLESCELLKNDRPYFLKLIKMQENGEGSTKLRNLLKLREFLIKNGLNDLLEKLSEIFEEISNRKFQNVLILNKGMFSGKTGTIEMAEEDLVEKEEEKVEERMVRIPLVNKKVENQEVIAQEEIDRVVKKLYMISQAFSANSAIRFAQIFDCYQSSSIIKILQQFEKVLIEEFSSDPLESHEKIIQIYFDYLNPELIYELDESTLNFIKDGLIFMNSGDLKIDKCENCEYPLNLWDLGTNKYESIGIRLQSYYWSRQEREKCFELALKIPRLLKIIGKFLIEERNYEKMIRYVVNAGDQELLRTALDQFNDIELFHELLDDFHLLIVERKVKCLNCFQMSDASKFKMNEFYTWNNLFLEIGKCLSGDELLNLLLNYSDQVTNLSREFYLRLLLRATETH